MNVEESKKKQKAARDRYNKANPWVRKYYDAKHRCSPKGKYSKKGIKMLMTMDDFRDLWFRDCAWGLERPSIDRIDPDGHYIYENCRYIELGINVATHRIPDRTGIKISSVYKRVFGYGQKDFCRRHKIAKIKAYAILKDVLDQSELQKQLTELPERESL